MVNDIRFEKPALFPDQVFTLDRKGIFQGTSPTGIPPFFLIQTELDGKSLDQTLPPDIAARTRECLGRALESGLENFFEFCLDIHGTERCFEIRLIPLEDNKARKVVREITGRVRIGESLQNSEV